MTEKARRISVFRRCAAAAGLMAVVAIAPAVAIVGGAGAVLASGNPNITVDSHGGPCPGSSYCIAPGPDPDLSYGTHPYVPFGPDPSMRGDQAF